VRKTQCPGCAERGEDTAGDNLNVFADERGGMCHKCNKYYPLQATPTTRNRMKNDSGLELSAIKKYPFRALEDRGISEETCRRFGVRVAVDEETAQEITDHFYPYYSSEGEIVGYKKRRLPKEFSVVGKIKGLFGSQQCKPNAKMLLVFEGEIDAMSAWEMLRQKGKNYNVASLPNGANEAGELDATTRKELEFFTSHKLVVICLDNDGPGMATTKALAEHLVSQCEVKIMTLKRKDTGKYLEAGDVEGWWSCLLGAKDYSPEAVENGRVDDIGELLIPNKKGVFIDFLPNTMKKLQGLRGGEITLLLAPTGTGKTTACRQVTYDLLTKQSEPVFNIFLEEGKKKTRQGIIALHGGVALNRFRRDPTIIPREVVEDANTNLLSRLELLTNAKSLLTDESLLNKLAFFVKVKGCKTGVLDHMSYVISSRDEKDERKAIDQLMTKLAKFVEDTDIHLILVVHINRKTRDRDKAGVTKYPYWELLTYQDGRGSGGLEHLVSNIIGIERQITDPADDTARPLTRTRIFKNREEGTIGLGDYLLYNTDKGALEPVEVDY